MEIDFIRDQAMYTAIFGFVAFVWFGMAQENPPKAWRPFLGIGSVVSLLISVFGIYLASTNWNGATALESLGNAYWLFGVVVFTEFTLIAVGSIILAKRKYEKYIAAWISLVVGLHFLPLAWIFQDTALYLLAAVVTFSPIFAFYYSKKSKLSVSVITCVINGVTLLAFSIRGLLLFFS